MSQENVEIFRKALDSYHRRDVEAMLEIWHPESGGGPLVCKGSGCE
jgi:hypothetical protein